MADVFDLLRDLSGDESLKRDLAADPDSVLAEYDLTQNQKDALKGANEQGHFGPICGMLNTLVVGDEKRVFC